jgi:hypothetical protein
MMVINKIVTRLRYTACICESQIYRHDYYMNIIVSNREMLYIQNSYIYFIIANKKIEINCSTIGQNVAGKILAEE